MVYGQPVLVVGIHPGLGGERKSDGPKRGRKQWVGIDVDEYRLAEHTYFAPVKSSAASGVMVKTGYKPFSSCLTASFALSKGVGLFPW